MKQRFLFSLLIVCCMLSAYGQDIVVRKRTCVVCNQSKPVDEFSGKSNSCKSCVQKAKDKEKRKKQEAEQNKPKQDVEARKRQEGKQNKPKQDVEAAGYDVTFMCNVPSASMSIDGVSNGTANGSRFLKTGSHTVNLSAEGYEDYSQSIVVNSSQRSFSMMMTKKKPMLSPVLQHLVDNMVYVEGGTFTMGATSEHGKDAFDWEKPSHQVALSSFSIGRYEVTQEEWEAVMGSNPSKFKGKRLPVETVSWNDCQNFIKKLNELTGKSFRLPTEAEWEYAARGGSKSQVYKYSGGKDIGAVAWYDGNSGSKTHEVGQKQPNELGLYDMSGNVLEWCNDWYGKYDSSSQTNPTGPSTGSDRVLRGGCWSISARYCRVSYRDYNSPDIRFYDLGLRLAL